MQAKKRSDKLRGESRRTKHILNNIKQEEPCKLTFSLLYGFDPVSNQKRQYELKLVFLLMA